MSNPPSCSHHGEPSPSHIWQQQNTREERTTTTVDQMSYSWPHLPSTWHTPSVFAEDGSGCFQDQHDDGMCSRPGLLHEHLSSATRPIIPEIKVTQPSPTSLPQGSAPSNPAHPWAAHELQMVGPEYIFPQNHNDIGAFTSPRPFPSLDQTSTFGFVGSESTIGTDLQFRPVLTPYDEYLALINSIGNSRGSCTDDLQMVQHAVPAVHNHQQCLSAPINSSSFIDMEMADAPAIGHEGNVDPTESAAQSGKQSVVEESGAHFISNNFSPYLWYQGDNSNYDKPPTQVPDALTLIGKHRDHRQSAHARPWGLQRILTHTFVEKQALKFGVPVPTITDDDISTYCSSPSPPSPFDIVHSTFPPEWIDIRFLGDMEISAEEILTFFPHHLKWHDAIFRLVQNGWSPHDMAKYINYARGLVSPNDKRGNTALKWLQSANGAILGKPKQSFKDRGNWSVVCFSAGDWVPYQHRTLPELTDYFLADLSANVVHLPQGDGARLLTRAIDFALTNRHYHVKLSQVRQYIRENLLFFPLLPSMVEGHLAGRNPDRLAIERARPVLENVKRERQQLAKRERQQLAKREQQQLAKRG